MGSQPTLQSVKEFKVATSGDLFDNRLALKPIDYVLFELQENGA